MLIIRNTLLIALAIIAVPGLTLCQTVRSQTAAQEAAAQEVLKTFPPFCGGTHDLCAN